MEYKDYYYKITNKKLESYHIKDKRKIQYKVDEWVSSSKEQQEQGYYPLVFKTVEDLKRYVGSMPLPAACAWKVEVIDVVPLNKRLINGKDYNLSFPQGSLMAKRVKLCFKLSAHSLLYYVPSTQRKEDKDGNN